MHPLPWFPALGPVMSNNGGMSRGCTGGERETLCGCHHGSSALSLSCKQTDRKHHYAAWRTVCQGWLWHPPLGGILMSSPGTSISHLTSWGEQGHPNTQIPPLSKTLSGHTLYTNPESICTPESVQQVPRVQLSTVQSALTVELWIEKVCMVGIVSNVDVY